MPRGKQDVVCAQIVGVLCVFQQTSRTRGKMMTTLPVSEVMKLISSYGYERAGSTSATRTAPVLRNMNT
jgi:hypothetical protein